MLVMDKFASLIVIDADKAYDGKLLGFDFGLKSIGVAVGQTLTRNATPLKSIAAIEGVPASWQEINALIEIWRPLALIVGIPLNMDDTPQVTTMPARTFAFTLKERYQLPVHGYDERLTTKEARAQLFEKKGYKGLKKGDVDAVSAALILEGWINATFQNVS